MLKSCFLVSVNYFVKKSYFVIFRALAAVFYVKKDVVC